MFFKGYVETKNKKCLEPFKNKRKFKSYEEVENLPEFAGILAKDTVLIDVDDPETSEILLNIVKDTKLVCRVYQTTRGKHFLFKNNGITKNKTHTALGVGFIADIKIGSNNSYEVIKMNGQERKIVYDATTNEEAQTLPKWLHPISTRDIPDFLNMKSGDGRNQALFNYILTLQTNDYSIEEVKETIRIINQYVVKVPLPKNEVDTILRDEAFVQPSFFKGDKFLFDKFAMFIKNNAHIIKINNQLHIYKNGIYKPGYSEIESAMIRHIPGLNRTKRAEVLAYLEILIQENTPAEDSNFIAFKNGLYDITDDSFTEFSPNHIITNIINWDYNPDAYSQLADKTLNKMACNDPDIRALLEESVGYCFYRRNELGKAFILTGDKSNGKSTFLSMIQCLLGDENISSLDLKELDVRFKTAEIFGKLANIGDDIGDEFIPDPAMFKKLVTGERVSAERKGQSPFEFNSYAKLLFSANNIPRIKDKTGAIQRRIIIIPFDAKFSSNDVDFNPYIKYLLKTDEVMEYLINLGIEGLKRILINKKFTESKRSQVAMDEYEEANNPVAAFISECEFEEYIIENQPNYKVYDHYCEFCLENNLQPLCKIEFSRQINKRLDMHMKEKKINGKKYKLFEKNKKIGA